MANTALNQPKTLSPELEAVVGPGPMGRTDVTKAIWAYIKENNLQDEKDKRNINTDEKLKAVFDGRDSINMMEIAKYLSAHMS